MGIQMGSGFTVQTGLPIDDRDILQTLTERDNIPLFRRYEGMMCYVVEEETNYQLMGGTANECWFELQADGGSMHIGSDVPEETDVIWFDPSDETIESTRFPENQTLKDFQDTSSRLLKKTTEIEAKTQALKGGTFFGDGETSAQTSGGNYLTFSIKTGLSRNLRQLAEGELVYCTDTNALFIGVRKNPLQSTITNVCIMGGTGGTDNTEPEWSGYVELTNNANIKYRLMAGEDGRLRLREASYYEAEDPKPSEATRFSGLLINRIFGGGALNANLSPVSHGFIEIYNNNVQGLTLNLKGLSVHYKVKADSVWKKLELEGYLPYQHSFLIRCGRHTSDFSANCRLKIKEFDVDWPEVAISDTGCMVYLCVGREVILVQNPFNYNDTGVKAEGYIDLFALGGAGKEDSVSGYEGTQGYYPNFGNYYTGAQRIDFSDTDNNYADIESVNYRTCDVNLYRPRCSTDGAWDLYYNKIKLNERIPNLINICYGKETSTRTFTWQSAVTTEGYVRYRALNAIEWIYVESEREMVRHHDQDCTVHRLFIRHLTPGMYEYQAGEEGAWSDLTTFEVIEHLVTNQSDRIKFLNVSDQQGNLALAIE